MESKFDFLNLQFFTKASVYPGSIGTFRYRFQRTGWMNDGTIQVWVYENISFEMAQDVETQTFPWTEEGVTAIKTWLEGMSRQERMDFVDTLYSILSVGGAKNLDAVLQPKNIRSMLKAIQDDEGKRRLLTSEIGEFLRIVSETSRRSRERRLPSSIHGKLLNGRK